MERRIRTNIPHAIPHRPSATRPDNPQNCNDQVSNNALHPRELHVKLLGRPGQLPQSLARHSIERSFNIVRKRCNYNDLNSMFEIVTGELRVKLGAVSALMETGPSRASRRRAEPDQRPSPTGVEGPEGTGGLRGAAPNEVRPPSLAGGRALRRPEHQRGHKQRKRAAAREGRRAFTQLVHTLDTVES